MNWKVAVAGPGVKVGSGVKGTREVTVGIGTVALPIPVGAGERMAAAVAVSGGRVGAVGWGASASAINPAQ